MSAKTTKRPRRAMEFKVQPIRTWKDDCEPLKDGARVAAFWRERIMPADSTRLDRMCVWVLCLDNRHRVIGYELLGVGTIDTVHLHPRGVFRAALAANAAQVVIIGNNVSGDPAPGEGTIKCAGDFVRAGRLMKIDVVDFVVVVADARPVSERNYCSLCELGYLRAPERPAVLRVKPAGRGRFQWN